MKFKNITLIGMAGAGKSAVGSCLAEKLGWKFIDTDRLIEQEKGKQLQNILNEEGEDKFKRLESKKVKELAAVKNAVLAPGGSIVYSQEAIEVLKKISKIFYLSADSKVIEKRIEPSMRGIVGFNGKNFRELYLEREELYKKFADFIIDTNSKEIREIVGNIQSALKLPL